MTPGTISSNVDDEAASNDANASHATHRAVRNVLSQASVTPDGTQDPLKGHESKPSVPKGRGGESSYLAIGRYICRVVEYIVPVCWFGNPICLEPIGLPSTKELEGARPTLKHPQILYRANAKL
jgi:hypothetical protein